MVQDRDTVAIEAEQKVISAQTDPICKFWVTLSISGIAEARHSKSGKQTDHRKF